MKIAPSLPRLEAEGYHVQLNGTATAPLTRCVATGGIHGLNDSDITPAGHPANPSKFTAIYVDIVCP